MQVDSRGSVITVESGGTRLLIAQRENLEMEAMVVETIDIIVMVATERALVEKILKFADTVRSLVT